MKMRTPYLLLLLQAILCYATQHHDAHPPHTHSHTNETPLPNPANPNSPRATPFSYPIKPTSPSTWPSPSPSPSPSKLTCPSPLTPCGSTHCYDPKTQHCCPSHLNICTTSQTCVQVHHPNGTIRHGCCPSGTHACGSACFNTSESRCCAVAGGTFGLRPAGAECYGDMCCEGGMVCAVVFEEPKCWAKVGVVSISASAVEEGVGGTMVSGDTTRMSGMEGAETTDIPNANRIGDFREAMKAVVENSKTRVKSGVGRVKVPVLFYILLRVLIVVANVFPTPIPAIDGEPVLPQMYNSILTKRESCHAPKKSCWIGCYDPSQSECCWSNDHAQGGRCPKGTECCNVMCCPADWRCASKSKHLPGDWWCYPERWELPIQEQRTTGVQTAGDDAHVRTIQERSVSGIDVSEKKGGGGHGASHGGGGRTDIRPGAGSGGSHSGTSRPSALCVVRLIVVSAFVYAMTS